MSFDFVEDFGDASECSSVTLLLVRTIFQQLLEL